MGSHHELLISSIGLPTSPRALCTYHQEPAELGRIYEKALRQEHYAGGPRIPVKRSNTPSEDGSETSHSLDHSGDPADSQ